MPAPISRIRSRAANEFGITKTMKPAALLAFISDIHSLTLQTAQGLYLTTGWYWDLNEETRAFGKRYFAKMKNEPTMDQAGYYSATMQYLKAVKTVGIDRFRQGHGGTEEDQDQRHVHQERLRPRRRLDGPYDVRHAGEDPGGVEIPLGLLQGDQGHVGRGGRRVATGSDLLAGQE